MSVQIGLERFCDEEALQKSVKGNLALLTHSAAVTKNFVSGVDIMRDIFGQRLKKLFGPQHGFVCDVQDNMVETDDFIHPYYKIPIYSLYGKTRTPTDESLKGIDSFIIDLQDVGTRVYTYISTLTLVLKKCARLGIPVFILDRPNPVGGEMIEGPVLQEGWTSFVGPLPLPQKHSLTLGETALFANKYGSIDADITVITMKNWRRNLLWKDLDRPWMNPSPNLSTAESALTYCGTVLFEGTGLSEGRGTTRALEVVGHPKLQNPHAFLKSIEKEFDRWGFTNECVLSPVVFRPMFQKHAGTSCGGVHIHPLTKSFPSWKLGQFLLKMFKRELGKDFSWQDGPYEYDYQRLPIDLINGGEDLRVWIDQGGDEKAFESLAVTGHKEFLNKRQEILLYPF